MPILWRFLLFQYLKVFCLSLFSFISVLLITRLDEIARFASLGAPVKLVLLFTLHQILYILPIAIPISALIASMILYQNLSRTHELTAMRSSGMGLKQITFPVILAGMILACLNFYIVSELATRSHLSSKQMVRELKSINPLLLLQNKQLVKLKDAYVDIGSLYSGEVAQDAVVIFYNRNTQRLNLMGAKTFRLSKSILFGENVHFISSLNSENSDSFDHLIIENQERVSTPASEFSKFLRTSGWHVNNDHLQFSLLLVRMQMEFNKLWELQKSHFETFQVKELTLKITRCFSEMSRRLSAAIAVFTFTLMGIAFGIDITRLQSKKGPLLVVLLAAFFLSAFFLAKNFDHSFFLATALYLFPHIIIVFLSIRVLRCVTRGIE